VYNSNKSEEKTRYGFLELRHTAVEMKKRNVNIVSFSHLLLHI